MEIIRKYHTNDFKNVLQLLNKAKNHDVFTDTLLEEKLYQDPDWNPVSTLVAEYNKEIIGFMQGVIREVHKEKYGYIKLMAVDEKFRRQGIATRMYNRLENWFKQNSIRKIRIYDVPLNYFVPGIDPMYTDAVCFVEKIGFKRNGEAVNMEVDLAWSEWNTDLDIATNKKKGIEIRRAIESDKHGIYNLISKEWILWKHEIDVAFKNNPASVFIAVKEDKVLAFSVYHGNNVGTGWFGPMGTHPELRGKGIGKILLYMCLKDMKNMGLKKSTIPWVAPISFYSHYTNAKISRLFWRYEKEINYNE